MTNKSFGWARVLYILMSIVYIIAGFTFFAYPIASEYMLGLFIGSLMLVYGVILVIGYFMATDFKTIWSLILGILLIVLGLVVSTNVFKTMNIMGVLIGIGFICSGVFKIYQSFQLKDFSWSQWWLVLILGIATLIVGCIMVFQTPAAGGYLTILVGTSFLVNGVSDLIVGIVGF